MTVTFSKDILLATQMTEGELLVELAVMLFEKDKLSLGKAAQMAGMNKLEFQKLLGSREISPHYGVEEYEQDLETLKKLGRL